MKKGDIVLVPFPFSDMKGFKTRPAIVLINNEFDVTLAFLTSELRWKMEFDFIIEPNLQNGLKVKSLVRLNKIATLDTDLVIGVLGHLSEHQMRELNSNLIRLLKLK